MSGGPFSIDCSSITCASAVFDACEINPTGGIYHGLPALRLPL